MMNSVQGLMCEEVKFSKSVFNCPNHWQSYRIKAHTGERSMDNNQLAAMTVTFLFVVAGSEI